jgi:hypothetical protein
LLDVPPATVSSSLSVSLLVAADLIAAGVSVVLMIFSIQEQQCDLAEDE